MPSHLAFRAVLFDIDGALVDSNYLHTDAWHQALAEVGHPADAWRIHRARGMDSGRLLKEFLGEKADQLGDAAKERHSAAYKRGAERLRPFNGARDLAEGLRARVRSCMTSETSSTSTGSIRVDEA